MKNREIKFRVWNEKDKCFIYYLPFDLSSICGRGGYSNHNIYYWFSSNIKENPKKCEIKHFNINEETIFQQYTGLKDKNGKEIYEGDIVKSHGDSMGELFNSLPKYEKGEIMWLREAFCICGSENGSANLDEYTDCGCCNTKLEIIGNIFENPDLSK